MFDMFWNSVLLFFKGKLFKDTNSDSGNNRVQLWVIERALLS